MEKTTEIAKVNGTILSSSDVETPKARARVDAADVKALSSRIATKVRAVTRGLADAGHDKALQDKAALKVACRLAFETASE
jgi:hypothetical protein